MTPKIPNTTKTIAPVSTRGRTAGWPHTPPLHGLKPKVLDDFPLAAEEESLKIEAEKNLTAKFIYTVWKDLYNWSTVEKFYRGFRECGIKKPKIKK